MKPSVLIRKLHSWSSIAVALPVLLVIATGILLQVKKQWSWVQPPEMRGSVTAPAIGFDEVLASIVAVPALGARGWEDIQRIDVRPGKGIAKVSLHGGYEVQVDLGNAHVLHAAYRRSDLIESLHDGSFFAGDWSKLGLFLPAGLVLLFLWASGVWLFVLPLVVRRRKAATRIGLESPAPVTARASTATCSAGAGPQLGRPRIAQQLDKLAGRRPV